MILTVKRRREFIDAMKNGWLVVVKKENKFR
jgi:hypothetical protein